MSESIIASNRKARHDYQIFECMEAGIQLTGTEVKSLRQGKCNLKDSFAFFQKNELFLQNMHIAEYAQGNINNHASTRPRKLLLHKRELLRIFGRLTQGNLTLIPLKLYWKHGLVKCEMALAKSNKQFDRRARNSHNDALLCLITHNNPPSTTSKNAQILVWK